jgi:hypothetical protein
MPESATQSKTTRMVNTKLRRESEKDRLSWVMDVQFLMITHKKIRVMQMEIYVFR